MRRTLLLLPLAVAACAQDSGLAKGESDDFSSAPSTSSEGDADTDADVDAEDTAPPEEEDNFLALAPAATDSYVFVANPTRDTVTRIAVPGLQVDTRTVQVA